MNIFQFQLFSMKIQKSASDSTYAIGLGLKTQVDPNKAPVVDSLLVDNFAMPIYSCHPYYGLPGE